MDVRLTERGAPVVVHTQGPGPGDDGVGVRDVKAAALQGVTGQRRGLLRPDMAGTEGHGREGIDRVLVRETQSLTVERVVQDPGSQGKITTKRNPVRHYDLRGRLSSTLGFPSGTDSHRILIGVNPIDLLGWG